MNQRANGHDVKEAARRIVDDLPDDAGWHDLMEAIYVRQAIEAGLDDCKNDRILSVEELRTRFGLAK